MKPTESINERSNNLSKLSSIEMVDLFIVEEDSVKAALELARSEIAKTIDIVVTSLKNGGRLFYIGAGTSGRLGVLDAAECPPTFGIDPELVQGIIAGGSAALTQAIEGAEDDEEAAIKIVKEKMRSNDVLIGISASGSTPYVCAALKAARQAGLKTIAIANNPNAESFTEAEHKIFLDTGAEIISGSTRLKAGTSQKLVLNMISSSCMVALGKTRGNLMTNLQAKNAKLKQRAIDLVVKISGHSENEARTALEKTNYEIEAALKSVE